VAGVELWRSFAAASAVVERRQASAPSFILPRMWGRIWRGARRAEARIVDYASVGVSPPFFLFSFFFLSCFLLVSFLALRAWIGMTGRTPPPASLNDRSKADVSCRFRAACRKPRMPAASRERWCLVLPLAEGRGSQSLCCRHRRAKHAVLRTAMAGHDGRKANVL
jgi:hypothetical protein